MNQIRTTRTQGARVTVVGLGPMGRAMANAYLDAGHEVIVWNRSTGKDDELVARGARRAAGIAEAVAASPLTVLSLIDVEAMYGTLGDTGLDGRVLVNLSSDVPEKARAAARWAEARGAAYLTGGVNVPPAGIGQEGSSIFISGPREVYEEHRAALDLLAATDYRGADPGHAQLYYQLNMILFWTAYTGWYQAVAVARANGLTAADILPYAGYTADTMRGFFTGGAPLIDADEHGGEHERLAMCAASVEHVLHTAADSGVDTGILAAHAALYRRGVEAGFGADSSSRLIRLLGNEATTA
ncbi:NAD(P)-binding domain-containing protein [Streptomyces sp. NBC_00160]|uniref:NAD(P)-dependent oxidoreductase n=1 Tax=Streptomyces TaxID=1883 RepID=UPI00207926B5|nr:MULTISPECIES: NAD(P)-binding domain-containing protein [Streptomyces]MCM9080981.1 NAD(P)-binding domain-containing protein [Streptomyces spororaveus]MCX5304572.1 NAD(P)-binding domain-containing protein [Streptomyces sp. NBC_00160]